MDYHNWSGTEGWHKPLKQMRKEIKREEMKETIAFVSFGIFVGIILTTILFNYLVVTPCLQ